MLHDNGYAVSIRMFAVELNKSGITCHPVEDERVPDERISLGKRRIDGVEGARIAGAFVGRRPKPSEEHLNMTIFESAQDVIERRLCHFRVYSAVEFKR